MSDVPTVSDTLRQAAQELAESSDTARLDVEILMADALGMSRSDMLLRAGDTLVPPEFGDYMERRKTGEPVAYILGRQEFFGREFKVDSSVLIPRGDSETVVAVALDRLGPVGKVLDLGTGSGALLVTLLAEKPGLRGVGIDRSAEALEVAIGNAASLGVGDRARFHQRDWRKPGWHTGLGEFDLIIANPPYVEADAELARDVTDFEPAGALFSGKDGLSDYRILIPQLRWLLKAEGSAVLEIGFRQDSAVSALALEHGFNPEMYRDLAGRPRAIAV